MGLLISWATRPPIGDGGEFFRPHELVLGFRGADVEFGQFGIAPQQFGLGRFPLGDVPSWRLAAPSSPVRCSTSSSSWDW